MVVMKEEEEEVAARGKMVFEPILEEGIFRFDCSDDDRAAAFPSLTFANPMDRDTPIIGVLWSPEFVPEFERRHCKRQTVKIQLPSGTTFYGIGEGGRLETGIRVSAWNVHAWGYGPGTPSFYQYHPWVLALLPDGRALGVLADTTWSCEIDLQEESTIKFDADVVYPVITFGPFESPVEVLVSLSHAIGTGFLPPKWSLGYHNYCSTFYSDDKVLESARSFREKGIPCDAIWMDFDDMGDHCCFTFDRERFPDPKSMVKKLNAIGIKTIWVLTPGIHREEGHGVYDSGCKSDVWIQKADGEPFAGDVWPAPCVFPDFTQQKARLWWANLVKNLISNGFDGICNDMNEPIIDGAITETMRESNIYKGDLELGGQQNQFHYHNASAIATVYGMLMARSTFEGMKMGNDTKRPFVLTRAGFIGSQRYAATWTKHIHSNCESLSMGLSGQPLSGPDIGGGLAGNVTPKLFGRSMGVGAMFPFCWWLSEMKIIGHEPLPFREECQQVCRLALLRRYRLLPHIYTLFYMAHTKGTPVVAPMFFADPKDTCLRQVENSFLLGPLLICVSTITNLDSYQSAHVLPKGIWLQFDFDDSHPDLPYMYLQGGSIIPVGLPLQHVGEAKPTDDLFLIIALDEYGKAEGLLFEDDGDGYEYTHGGYLLTYYVAEMVSSVVTVKVSKTEGKWERQRRNLHVHLLLGGGDMIKATGTDGEELSIKMLSESEQQSFKGNFGPDGEWMR